MYLDTQTGYRALVVERERRYIRTVRQDFIGPVSSIQNLLVSVVRPLLRSFLLLIMFRSHQLKTIRPQNGLAEYPGRINVKFYKLHFLPCPAYLVPPGFITESSGDKLSSTADL